MDCRSGRNVLTTSASTRTTPTATSAATINSSLASATPSRPQGIKAAKEAERAAVSVEQINKRLAAFTAQLVELSQKRLKMLEGANVLMLFSIPLDRLDAKSREYVCSRRAEIVDEASKAHAIAAENDAAVMNADGCEPDVPASSSARAVAAENDAAVVSPDICENEILVFASDATLL